MKFSKLLIIMMVLSVLCMVSAVSAVEDANNNLTVASEDVIESDIDQINNTLNGYDEEDYSIGSYKDICSVEIRKNFTNSDLKNNEELIHIGYYDEYLSKLGGNIVVLFNDTVYYNQSTAWHDNETGYDYEFDPDWILYSDLNKNLTSGVYNVKVKFIYNTTEDLMHESYMGVVLDNIVNSDNVQKQTKVQKTSQSIKLTLKKINVKKSAKKLVLKATLKINGKIAKGKKITFKFNKKTYKAKTNKKGVAKVTIKKSVLKKLKVGKKVKYQAGYGKTIVKKTVKVKK